MDVLYGNNIMVLRILCNMGRYQVLINIHPYYGLCVDKFQGSSNHKTANMDKQNQKSPCFICGSLRAAESGITPHFDGFQTTHMCIYCNGTGDGYSGVSTAS